MAEAIGATAVRLAPGSKAAYHAAAVLAAGGFVALLDAIAELGAAAGLDEAGSLAVYGGLIEQTLGNARALGIRAALTGPMTRGDVGTLARHLEALARLAPGGAAALPRRGRARDRARGGAWLARAGSRGIDAPLACDAGLTRYHEADGAQHHGSLRRPPGGALPAGLERQPPAPARPRRGAAPSARPRRG